MAEILDYVKINFPALVHYKYVFLFVAASLEGFNTMVLTGFLVSIGAFALVPAALICLAGEIINSYFWYGVGYYTGGTAIDFFAGKRGAKRKVVEKIRSYLERYTGRVLLLMKATFSFTIVTLILTGSIKYNLKKFSFYNFIGSIVWIIITFSIGFFFGQGYKLYLGYLENLSYLIIFIVLFLLIVFAAEKVSRAIFVRLVIWTERVREVGQVVRDGLDKLISDRPDDTHK